MSTANANSLTSLPMADDCWRKIGISGDRSCPELQTYIHCRSCPVYSRAARTFFDREAPEGYLEEWTRLLSREKQVVDSDSLSVLIFRLSGEWLALPTRLMSEVTHPRPVHRVPHRSNESLLGLVSIRGQLQLCVSMHGMLGVAPLAGNEADALPGDVTGKMIHPRLIVLERKGQRWVFPADDVRGVARIPRGEFQTVPSTLTRVSSFSQAVFPWNTHIVGLLDDERVLLALRSLGL
ncbi:chemotaxis protein CheW [Singulisphaera sp. PoT]|uniref:chemotaxis protein CheW n=1 Tax=Singulisphaera sp. PoT TaxID=3411797 RepID=UPI003BF45FF1